MQIVRMLLRRYFHLGDAGGAKIVALLLLCAVSLPCKASQIGCNSVVMSGPGYVGLDDNRGNPLSPNVLASSIQANVMGEPFTLTLTINCAKGPSWTGEAVAWMAEYKTGSATSYTPFSITQPVKWITVPGGGSTTVSFTFKGLPDSVQPSINTIIDFGCTNPNIPRYPNMARETRFDIDTTYYLPDAPQQRPFLGVITDACNWSKGTSQYGAVEAAITTGLYNCGYITYGATGFTGFKPNAATPTGETFYLTKYLYARPMHLTAACYDIANYLLCCANALGL